MTAGLAASVVAPYDEWDADVLTVARRRLPWVLAGALLCAAAFWAGAHLRTATYTASAEVQVSPIVTAPLTPRTSAAGLASAMQSEAARVTTAAVLRAAAARLGREPVPAAAVRVDLVSNAPDLDIAFTGSTPAAAQAGAEAVAEAFLDSRAGAARSYVTSTEAAIQAKLTTATDALAAPQVTRGELIAGVTQAAALRQQLADVQAIDTDPGSVISEPNRPTRADGVAAWAYALAGALIGLLAVIGLLYARRRIGAIRGVDLAAVRGCPVLAVLPPPTPGEQAVDPLTQAGYQQVRVALAAQTAGSLAGSTIAVTHAGPARSQPADVTRALGRALAAAGHPVSVVGARAGTDAEDLREQVAGPRLRTLFDELATTREFVLAAAPPANTDEGDAVAMAAGQAIVTATDGITTMRGLGAAVERLRALGVRVLGIVVVGAGGPSRPGARG